MPSVITIPAGLLVGSGFGMGQQRYDQFDQSEADGSSDTRLRGRPRWVMKLAPPAKLRNTMAEALLWENMVWALNGRVNVLAAYDFGRPNPIGGAWATTVTTSGALAAGATTVTLAFASGDNGKQLQGGDKMQIGTGFGTSELVRVTSATVASGGTCTVTFDPPLRRSYTSGTSVTLNKPLGYFMNMTDRNTWQYDGNGLLVSGFALDLLERWR